MSSPETPAPQGHLLEHVIAFTRLLHEMGVPVGPGQALDLVEALRHVSITAREDFRAAARCTLIRRAEDLPLFELAFGHYWRTEGADPLMMALPVMRVPGRPMRLPRATREPGEGEEREEREERVGVTLAYAQGETLRSKDFGTFSWEEVQACNELLRRMPWRLPERQTRRVRPAPRGRRLDLPRVLRRSLRTGGEPMELAWRERKPRRRPLVVLCDISGSMDRYSRMLLQFVHTLAHGLGAVESFVFGTRLTRITRLLRHRDIDDAVALVSKQVLDWSGGTRIGETLKEFNYRWGRRVLHHGAVVLLISDGWDRGEPQLLGREMGRLQRSCHRLIWLNPLLGRPGYQPLTQGMQAALPFVDDFLPVHNLVSLEQLGAALAQTGDKRPERRQSKG
jgi:uncharacterized protein with von Willebrand factor type A (vWA) domain